MADRIIEVIDNAFIGGYGSTEDPEVIAAAVHDHIADTLDVEEGKWTWKADMTLTEIEIHAADAVLRNLRTALLGTGTDHG